MVLKMNQGPQPPQPKTYAEKLQWREASIRKLKPHTRSADPETAAFAKAAIRGLRKYAHPDNVCGWCGGLYSHPQMQGKDFGLCNCTMEVDESTQEDDIRKYLDHQIQRKAYTQNHPMASLLK